MPLGVQTNIVTTKPGQDFVLPPANSNTGQTILVKNTSIVSDLLVRTSGKDLIDNVVSTYALGALECLEFYSDGQTWWGTGSLTASAGGGSINISGGTTSQNLTNLVFADAGGVSFGLNGSTLTGSAPTAAPSPVNFSAGSTSQNLGSVVFANGSNVSFGLNGSTITGSVLAQSVQPVALSAANGSATFGTWLFSNANGISFSTAAGPAISASYTVPGATVFSNSNNVSFGLNGSTVTATATFAGGGGAAISAAGNSISAGTAVWSNSNNVSFGMNASTITATATFAQSVQPVAVSNSAGSFTFSTLNFSNANNVTWGTSAGGIVTASVAAPGGGAGVNRNYVELMDGARITTCALLNNATYSNRVIFVPFVVKEGVSLSVNTVEMFLSRTGGTILLATMGVGIYTQANSSSLNLAFSTTHVFSVQSSVSWSGIRGYQFTGMGANTLSAGEYVFGFYNSAAASNSIGLNVMGGDGFALAGYVFTGTNQTSATNSSRHLVPFWGVWNATTAAFPAAVQRASISGGNPAVNSPDIYAVIREI